MVRGAGLEPAKSPDPESGGFTNLSTRAAVLPRLAAGIDGLGAFHRSALRQATGATFRLFGVSRLRG